jgi:hypothetical protein
MAPPPMSSELHGCLRQAIAAAMSASSLLTPGDFAKSIILSALSCWSQTPPVERSALMPATPAKLTHGSLVRMSPPLASCGWSTFIECAFAFKWRERMGWYAHRLGDPAISARQREGRSVRDEGGGIESCGGDGGVLYATQL